MSVEDLPYAGLSPDVVLDGIERFGVRCSGALYPLNSYENRVYLAELEDEDTAVVAKFYRPRRWTTEAILEEHEFSQELAAHEIPVASPMALPTNDANGDANGAVGEGPTLAIQDGYRVAVYPRIRGRAPEIDHPETLAWLGRFLGRIHAVAATGHFEHRPRLTVETFGYGSLNDLLETDLLPLEVATQYEEIARELLAASEARIEAAGPTRQIRLHGDCHASNILWTYDGPFFVDLDDCRTGPAIQDLWMLLSGPKEDMSIQLGHILRGYQMFHDFNPSEIAMIEPLRALRAVYYASWLAKRWHDPAFPLAFPWFGTVRYWEDQVQQLYNQLDRLDQVLYPDY